MEFRRVEMGVNEEEGERREGGRERRECVKKEGEKPRVIMRHLLVSFGREGQKLRL